MGSFQSVHSNAVEKNRILYTLLQHGVETTVDRTQKNSRIINWINQQGGHSIDKKFGLSFGLKKRIEIPFKFRDMSKLPTFEHFLSVRNHKPKLK